MYEKLVVIKKLGDGIIGVYDAVDECAKIEAIGFAEWIMDGGYFNSNTIDEIDNLYNLYLKSDSQYQCRYCGKVLNNLL